MVKDIRRLPASSNSAEDFLCLSFGLHLHHVEKLTELLYLLLQVLLPSPERHKARSPPLVVVRTFCSPHRAASAYRASAITLCRSNRRLASKLERCTAILDPRASTRTLVFFFRQLWQATEMAVRDGWARPDSGSGADWLIPASGAGSKRAYLRSIIMLPICDRSWWCVTVR